MLKLPGKFIPVLLFILFLIPVSSVFAVKQTKTRVIVDRDETIANDYFALGDKVTISGVVSGDAYVAAKDVVVDGMVRGDLLVAAASVTVTGEVGQNIRIIAGSAEINGKVGKNISVAAGTVVIGKEAVVNGNVVGVFAQLTYKGQAMGNLNLTGGNIEIDGRNDGDVYLRADNILIDENAQIFGNLTYESRNQAVVTQGAHIYGMTFYNPINNYVFSNWSNIDKTGTTMVKKGFSLVGFLVAFLIGFVCLRIFPRRMLHMNVILAESPFKTLLVGLLLFMITPLLVILLSITIIGMPVAIVWIFYLAIMVYFAKIFVGFFLGEAILRKFKQGNRRGWALLTGLVIYAILRELPFVGWIFSLLVILAGVGVAIREKAYLYHRVRVMKIF